MSDDAVSRRRFLGQSGTCLVLLLGVPGLTTGSPAPQAAVRGEGAGAERRYPVPAVDGALLDADAQVLLVRTEGRVVALSLACPHEHAAVRWVAAAGRFQCTKHDSRYTPDGHFVSGRSTRGLDRFPIRRDGPSVVVDVTRVWRADADAAAWTAASVPVE